MGQRVLCSREEVVAVVGEVVEEHRHQDPLAEEVEVEGVEVEVPRPLEEEAVGVEEEVPRLLEGAAAVGEEAVHH